MKRSFSTLSLLALSLSTLGQAPAVFANTTTVAESTTQTETAPTTASLTESTSALTTVTTTAPTTAEPSTEPPTTSAPTTSVTTTEAPVSTEVTTETTTAAETTTATAKQEALPTVGGLLDTVVLPDGRLIFKVRLYSLIDYWYSDIKYQIIHNATGKNVSSGSLSFSQVDGNILKSRANWGKNDYYNVVTYDISAYQFSDDPQGRYTLKVFGNIKSGYNQTVATTSLSKQINMADTRMLTTAFTKVGGSIDLTKQPDGSYTYRVRLNQLIDNWYSETRYRLIHKKSGKVIRSGSLSFNQVDGSVLINRNNWGRSDYYNVATGEIPAYEFSDDPKAEYIFQAIGDSSIGYNKITGIINLSKGINVPKPIPASQRSVYRLYHSGLMVHLYTKDLNEFKILQSRGWTSNGLAWRTETVKGKPVYRLYHPGQKYHFYTTNLNEYNILGTRGWKKEGVAFRDYGTVKVYRLYHPGLRKHLFTRDVNERNVLQQRGWRYEGIAWNSQP